MIVELREYLRSMILGVDSDLIENPSAFLDSDIGETLLDRSYQITLTPGAVTVRNSHIERITTAQISLFAIGGRDQIKNYDELLDKAICIEDSCLALKNFNAVAMITNIISDGLNTEKYPSADDTYKVDINLSITQAYSRE